MRLHRMPLLLLLAACGHSEPFSYSPELPDAPAPGTPARLTVNPLRDGTPSWLPDGSGILYAAARGDRFGDSCLMIFPPAGGGSKTAMCYPTFPSLPVDTLRVIAWASVSPGGRLAYTTTASRRFVAGRVRQVKWGTFAELARDHRHVAGPLDLFGGRQLEGTSFLRWLDENHLVYQADFLGAGGADSLISGRFLVLATINGDTMDRVFIAGSDYASSVTVLHADTIAFTRGNDSRVFTLALSSGVSAVLYDFGPGNVARDLYGSGPLLSATVGGLTGWMYDSAYADTIQLDGGGNVWLLDRVAGSAQQINTDTLRYRYPAVSPDGRRIVAAHQEDLYLFTMP